MMTQVSEIKSSTFGKHYLYVFMFKMGAFFGTINTWITAPFNRRDGLVQ